MIYVTHDQTEALTFADKVIVMYDGRVVQIGTSEELFERPGHTFVGYFIGSPGMNLFDARIDGNTGRIGDHTVDLGARNALGGGTAKIGVRPEYIRFDEIGLPAEMLRVEDVGRHRIVRLRAAGQSVAAIAEEGRPVPAGRTHIRFAAGGVHVYESDWRVAPEGPERARSPREAA